MSSWSQISFSIKPRLSNFFISKFRDVNNSDENIIWQNQAGENKSDSTINHGTNRCLISWANNDESSELVNSYNARKVSAISGPGIGGDLRSSPACQVRNKRPAPKPPILGELKSEATNHHKQPHSPTASNRCLISWANNGESRELVSWANNDESSELVNSMVYSMVNNYNARKVSAISGLGIGGDLRSSPACQVRNKRPAPKPPILGELKPEAINYHKQPHSPTASNILHTKENLPASANHHHNTVKYSVMQPSEERCMKPHRQAPPVPGNKKLDPNKLLLNAYNIGNTIAAASRTLLKEAMWHLETLEIYENINLAAKKKPEDYSALRPSGKN